MTNIQKADNTQVALAVDESLLLDYMDTMGLARTAPTSVKQMFLQVCKAFQLNPFKRQAYLVGYGTEHKNWSVITGYEEYLNRANATERLDGWKVDITGKASDNSLRAKLTIYRKDFSHPFEWEAWYYECVAKDRNGNPTPIWKQRPVHMIKKVAIAQGFRLCFPEALQGMPYTDDEMGAQTYDVPHTEMQPEQKQKVAKKENPVPVPPAVMERDAQIHEEAIDPDFISKDYTDTEEPAPWEAAEEVSAPVPEPTAPPVAVSAPADEMITKAQKTMITQFLTAKEVTDEERTKMNEAMPNLTKARASAAIIKLQETIKQRREQTQAA